MQRIIRNTRATFFFVVAGVGLLTAWYFNTIAIFRGQDFFGSWFGNDADLVLACDLLLTAFAAVPFMVIESKRIGMKKVGWYIAAGFISAIAFVFPFWLAMRELHLAKEKATSKSVKSGIAVHSVKQGRELAGGTLEYFELEGRRIDVWVPANHDELTPLLVAHDGANFLRDISETWNHQNWGIPEAFASGRVVTPDGRLPIVVGVYRTDDSLRLNELAPEDVLRPHPEMLNQIDPILRPTKPEYMGNTYQDFLSLTLIPELAKRYSLKLTPSRTALMGSSLGGLATIYGVAKHPEVFGVGLALSSHWPLGGQQMVDLLLEMLPASGQVRIYTDAGTLDIDADYYPWHFAVAKKFEAMGWQRDVDFRTELWPGTGHKESWWSQRVEHPINWWLNS